MDLLRKARVEDDTTSARLSHGHSLRGSEAAFKHVGGNLVRDRY
jgi:hypothetical protein